VSAALVDQLLPYMNRTPKIEQRLLATKLSCLPQHTCPKHDTPTSYVIMTPAHSVRCTVGGRNWRRKVAAPPLFSREVQ